MSFFINWSHTIALDFAWKNGVKLGKGVYGETKLVSILDNIYVAKKFKSEDNKQDEESKHLTLWKRLGSGCQKYFCKPIPSRHKQISLQLPAGGNNQNVVTLENFIMLKHKHSLNQKLTQLYGTVLNAVRTLFADALRCMHMAGVVHGNVKHDNVLVVYTLDNENFIKTIHVKIIDMGLIEISTHKSLVRTFKPEEESKRNTVPIDGTLRRSRLYEPSVKAKPKRNLTIKGVRNASKQLYKPSKHGKFFNNLWILPLPPDPNGIWRASFAQKYNGKTKKYSWRKKSGSMANTKMLDEFEHLLKRKVLGRELHQLRQKQELHSNMQQTSKEKRDSKEKRASKKTIENHYTNAVKQTENAAVKRIERCYGCYGKRHENEKSKMYKQSLAQSINNYFAPKHH